MGGGQREANNISLMVALSIVTKMTSHIRLAQGAHLQNNL